jgi:pilus assembly protein CpaC
LRVAALASGLALVVLAPTWQSSLAQNVNGVSAAGPGAGGLNAAGVVERTLDKHAGELVVPLNKSQVLKLQQPFVELFVGNPEIADVLALTDQSIYVLGKALGTTNLTIYGPNKSLIGVLDLAVAYDLEGLKAKLHELMPNQKIEVRAANDALVLSGQVANSDDLSRAVQVAERYAPKKVTNFLSVKGSQQVMLKIRFVELSRSVSKELDFDSALFAEIAGYPFAITNLSTPGASAFLATFAEPLVDRGDLVLGPAVLEALEERGLARLLAEPNLIALTGETASFLAGGEIPIPVPQTGVGGGSTITIEFKPFGVGLAFTPTVLADGLVSLVVAPEVSAIDNATGIILPGGCPAGEDCLAPGTAGFVPGFKTNRAKTTIELRDGQSFAIAGLLQDDLSENISQFPWLGDVPILGILFRSPDFQRKQTELVVIVDLHLVKPVKNGTLATPDIIAPTEAGFFLGGQMEGGVGAMSGPFGHMLP